MSSGLRRHRLYNIWRSMRQRCNNKNAKDYKWYGGKGITVCSEWDDFEKFYEWACSNGYYNHLVLDRKERSKGYSPDNCRWVDDTDSARNRSNNRLITAFGETKTLIEWAEDERCVVAYGTLKNRVRKGWDGERLITTPHRDAV